RILASRTQTRMARPAGVDQTRRGAIGRRSASVHDASSIFQGSAGAAAIAGIRSSSMNGRIEPIVGRYVHVDIAGVMHRIYFEENGSGIPLVCLHTAGSDNRQWRHLLCDE